MKFNKDYYETNNYKNYLSRGERYLKLAEEINSFFEKIGLDLKNEKTLDYGCAVGFLIEGLQKIGYKKIQGFEISEWAKSVCSEKGIKIIENNDIEKQKLTIFLDVLEHIDENSVDDILSKLKSDFILIRIPVCAQDNGNFILEISEKDSTHINRKCKKTWINVFEKNGFDFFCCLNLNNIYDSKGVFCALFKQKSFNLSDFIS